jgi:hypothetical protein
MAKNTLYINVKESNPDLSLLIDFLKNGSISSRAIEALEAFYMSLAVADSPDSTKEDIAKAEHYCLSKLKGHMCYLMDKHYRDDDIRIDPDSFSTVMISQVTQGYVELDRASNRPGKSMMQSGEILPDRPGAEVNLSDSPNDSAETTGQYQERSDEISREIADRSSTAFASPTEAAFSSREEPQTETEDDEDYDPDDDLTDDEYAAKVLARIPNNQITMVD